MHRDDSQHGPPLRCESVQKNLFVTATIVMPAMTSPTPFGLARLPLPPSSPVTCVMETLVTQLVCASLYLKFQLRGRPPFGE